MSVSPHAIGSAVHGAHAREVDGALGLKGGDNHGSMGTHGLVEDHGKSVFNGKNSGYSGKWRGTHVLDSDFPPLKPSNRGFDQNQFPSVWSKPKANLQKLSKTNVGIASNGMFAIPERIINVGEKLWEFAFVGHIIDKNLPFSLVYEWARRTWGDVVLEVIKLEPNFFLFKVGNELALNNILSGAPSFIAGRLMVIKRWNLGMILEKEYFSKIPVWITLKNLPIVLRSIEGLEFIGSTLGNPLFVDLNNLARICVEIDAEKEVPNSMMFDLGKGIFSEILFEIPWKPSRCGRCKVFGHSS